MAPYTQHASNARPSERLLDIAIYILLTLGAVVMLLPFAWMLSTSLKTPPEIFTYPITWIPTQLAWDNYRKAFEALPFEALLLQQPVRIHHPPPSSTC